MLAAAEAVQQHGALPVPLALRNAPTPLMKGLGYGAAYRYPHDYEGGVVAQQCLPDRLADAEFYAPTDRGDEAVIRARLCDRAAKASPATDAARQSMPSRGSSARPRRGVDGARAAVALRSGSAAT
jgi:replication-associated recombination protein RarA